LNEKAISSPVLPETVFRVQIVDPEPWAIPEPPIR